FFCSLLAPSDAILFQEGVSVKLRLPHPSELHDGGVRTLGIPTVVDRPIQQAIAIAQHLSAIVDKSFSDSRHGFRLGRNVWQAVQ
ncbi:hypothetical protein QP334_23100, partial [Escherichia coli]|nr:hypothetical protein [Escherichia coli]MDK6792714.1 hypothetical protein [Escherichia coli]MDM8609086.1 hypothetical protein [Escherichia coli]MDM8617717.1 hypothetical protein [Escherichia coli]MDM8636277.1 hypothetical protein [Escherichia coli]